MLPLFEVKTQNGNANDKAIKEMTCIAEKRIVGNCIPSEIISKAAVYSGGLMHDFLRLLGDSCLKAMINGKYKISLDLLEESFTELSNDYRASVESGKLSILKKIVVGKTVDMDEDVKKLLFSLVILQYINDKREIWYDVHPAVIKAFKSELGND